VSAPATLLKGLTAGELLTPQAPYRATWRRDTVAIAAVETVTLGGAKTTQADLATELDEQLSTTCFVRGGPIVYTPTVITWDLVARSNALHLTAAQGARLLDQASAYLRLETLEPRTRVTGDAAREAQRAASEVVAAAQVASRPTAIDNLLGGLKAFGLTTAVLAVGGLVAYFALTRRRD
jgi:hypothetical protein